LIHAMRDGNAEQRALLREAISNADVSRMPEIVNIIQSTHAVEKSMAAAQESAQQAIHALAVLPASEYKDALVSLAHHSVVRRH